MKRSFYFFILAFYLSTFILNIENGCNGETIVYQYATVSDWNNKANWFPNRLPVDGDDVVIGFQNANAEFSVTYQGAPLNLSSLTVGGKCGDYLIPDKRVGPSGSGPAGATGCKDVSICKQIFRLGSNTQLTTNSLVVYAYASVALSSNSTLSVASPVRLYGSIQGNGTLRGDIFMSEAGTLSPWSVNVGTDYLAKLTIEGDVTIKRGALIFDVNARNGMSDVISVHHMNVDGTCQIVLNDISGLGYDRVVNGSFNLLEMNSSLVGSFSYVRVTNMTFEEHLSPRIWCGDLTEVVYNPSAGSETGTGTAIFPNNCPVKKNQGFTLILSTTSKCCPTGWSGPNCDVADCPGEPDCSGRGVCSSIGLNTEPFCECPSGWKGYDCSIADCPGDTDCNSHGRCDSSLSTPVCVCDSGWSGLDCGTGLCPGSPQCSNHGDCFLDVSPPVCDCNVGFSGETCSEVLQAGQCSNNCSSHGICNNGTCQCDNGWELSDCSLPVCNGSTSCNFRGDCTHLEVENDNVCVCREGWKGDTCEVAICKNECSGAGDCLSETTEPTCNCYSGRSGDDCSKVESSNQNGEGVSSGLIIGVVVAGFVVILAGVVGVFIYKKKQNQQEQNDMELTVSK